jgi:glutamine synthetase type III
VRLERNVSPDGLCKYIAIKVNKLKGARPKNRMELIKALMDADDDAVVFGEVGSEDEFFLLMLKDENTPEALAAYGRSIFRSDPAMAYDVQEMMNRSLDHPSRKKPD